MSVVHQGWVLKKRRKKMQGFARRYFVLNDNGLLSYSFEPGQPIRDQLDLSTSAISTTGHGKDIHIDSNMATFHIKCLSTDDYAAWMSVIRSYTSRVADSRRSASIRAATRRGSLQITRSNSTNVDEMGLTIAELEAAISAMSGDSKRSKADKDKSRESARFGLFKRSSPQGTEEPPPDAVETPLQRANKALQSLKAQHATLSRSIVNWSQFDVQSTHASPLPMTTEEDERETISNHSLPFSSRPSNRGSVSTSTSDEWYDASSAMHDHDGPQEFLLDPSIAEPSRIMDDAQSSHDDGSSIDTDLGLEQPVLEVVRRTELPVPVFGDEGSLFAILKKSVGKDLSTITFPVTFNEPLSLLQRTAEELEYYELLDQAAASNNPLDRMCHIAAFAVSSYTHTRHRSGRKGFNPMLGETFEDARMKFIAEKVRHNPVEMAYHAAGNHWEMWGTSAGKTKFWGKSLEITPLGTTHVKIGDDHFEWGKPSSFVRNLVVGTKYLEHNGKMTIENKTDGTRCVLDFKPSGYWAPSNVVSGSIFDNGTPVCHLEGKWDDQFACQLEGNDPTHLRVLWRATPWPKNTHDFYGFTLFAITLNEITSDILDKLPPTDSRYRPDIRALETGDLDLAEEHKARVEEMQRERRKEGNERQPRWFRLVNDEWLYTGGYWEARAKGWKNAEKVQPLW